MLQLGGATIVVSVQFWMDLEAEPREFPDELDAGMRGKESWRTPGVWPENPEGWRVEFPSAEKEWAVGRTDCGRRVRSSVLDMVNVRCPSVLIRTK